MINDFIQLFENAGVPLPNENSLGEKIIPDDDPVKLQNFWNWFGNSKLVDEQGRPLVVYHGTNAKFNIFNNEKPIWVTPRERYAGMYSDTGNVMPVYAKLENPANVDNINGTLYAEKAQQISQATGISEDELYNIYKDIMGNTVSTYVLINSKGFRNALIKKGFDGIKAYEAPHKTYAVFEPNQIKSVNNNGEFSMSSDNIYETVAYHGTPQKFDEFSLTESYSKYKKQQEEVLTETLRNEGGFFITSSGNDIINLMKNKPKEYRIVYDSNLDLYMICDANDAIHQEMLEKAYNNGLYYNMEEFIDSLGIFQNYIEVGQDGGWDDDGNEIESYLYYMIFDPSNTWAVGDDDYNEVYNLSFGNLFTRGCDITETPFYNLISKYMV